MKHSVKHKYCKFFVSFPIINVINIVIKIEISIYSLDPAVVITTAIFGCMYFSYNSITAPIIVIYIRSEERRVGKECSG